MRHSPRSAPNRREFLRACALTLPTLGGIAALLPHRLAAQEPHPTKMPLNTMTDDDEIALGDIIAGDLEKDLLLINNSLIDAYLGNIVEKLAKASQRPNLPYRCKLVNTEEINAFSIPGGHIYLNRGIVQALSHEDELAATLAHEIGHVVGHHSANKIMLTFRARQAYDLVKNNIPEHAQLIQEVITKLGGPLALLALLKYGRENELEADKLGFYEMLRAGYQPAGMVETFEMLVELEKGSDKSLMASLLRDHPPAEERADAIRKELALVAVPKDATTDSLSFHAFQLAMNVLPAPPKPKSEQR